MLAIRPLNREDLTDLVEALRRYHGGYQASGFGKDMSAYSFDEYTQIKHVMSALSGQPRKQWHDMVFTSRPGRGPSHGMTA